MRVLSHLTNRAREESGAVLIWVGVMIVVLVGFAAFAVDLGHAYAVKRQMSVVADGAALAGAQEAGLKYKALGGCNTSLKSAAVGAAQANYAANVPHGGPDSLPSDAVVVSCPDDTRVTVEVTVEGSIDTSFGQVLGVATMNPGASATADIMGTRQLTGMRPFTVCLEDALDAAANGGTHQSAYHQSNSAPEDADPCNPSGAGGNWGYATFGLGTSDGALICLIKHGYPGYSADDKDCDGWPNDQDGVDVGAPPPGDPVNSPGYAGNSIQGNPNTESKDVQALNSLVGETILLPVAGDWIDGNGSNAEYTGMGAIAVEFCGWAMPKQAVPGLDGIAHKTGDCWSNTIYDESTTKWPQQQDVPSLVIQWRYTGEWTTSSVGQGSETSCDLSDPNCWGRPSLIE